MKADVVKGLYEQMCPALDLETASQEMSLLLLNILRKTEDTRAGMIILVVCLFLNKQTECRIILGVFLCGCLV